MEQLEIVIYGEIDDYKEKIKGLTVRQWVFAVLAIAVVVPTYILVPKYTPLNTDVASYIVLVEALIIGFFGFIKIHNLNAEELVPYLYRHYVLFGKPIKYMTDREYAEIHDKNKKNNDEESDSNVEYKEESEGQESTENSSMSENVKKEITSENNSENLEKVYNNDQNSAEKPYKENNVSNNVTEMNEMGNTENKENLSKQELKELKNKMKQEKILAKAQKKYGFMFEDEPQGEEKSEVKEETEESSDESAKNDMQEQENFNSAKTDESVEKTDSGSNNSNEPVPVASSSTDDLNELVRQQVAEKMAEFFNSQKTTQENVLPKTDTIEDVSSSISNDNIPKTDNVSSEISDAVNSSENKTAAPENTKSTNEIDDEDIKNALIDEIMKEHDANKKAAKKNDNTPFDMPKLDSTDATENVDEKHETEKMAEFNNANSEHGNMTENASVPDNANTEDSNNISSESKSEAETVTEQTEKTSDINDDVQEKDASKNTVSENVKEEKVESDNTEDDGVNKDRLVSEIMKMNIPDAEKSKMVLGVLGLI